MIIDNLKSKISDPLVFRGIKNASFLSAGNFISMVIGFIGFIYIARMFGPERFGIYSTVIAFVTFFLIFTLSGLPKVIVREGSRSIGSLNRTLDELIGVRLLSVIIAVGLCVGICLLTDYSKLVKTGIIIFSTELIYVGINSFLETIYQTVEKMQYLVYFNVSTRLFITLFSILALSLGAGILLILGINLLVKFLILCINHRFSRKFAHFKFNWSININKALLMPTLVFSLMGFINAFSIKIDLLVISFLSTSVDVGIYGVAHGIAREGLTLRNLIVFAFFPLSVKLIQQNKVNVKNLFLYSFLFFLCVLCGCVVFSFFASDVVGILFGREYALSAPILRALLFFLPFAFFTLPLTTYLQASNREKLLLLVQIVSAILNLILNVVFFYMFGLIGIAYATIVIFFIQSILLSYFVIRKKKRSH